MQSTASIFQSVFKKDIAAPDTAEFLAKLAKEHPHFTPAQFFLLQQNKDDKMQAAKTSVLFNNPLWLNWLLNKDEAIIEDEIIPDEAEPAVEAGLMTEEMEYKSVTPPMLNKEPTAGDIKITIPPIEELLFQPLYTSDYFASQGIKLSDEILATDKLGKQLKSFTEWLKTMKKVHVEKMPSGNEQVDIVIQSLAEKSNSEGEVVTEAMAEVFAMQGKTGKAIEVYEKLSLLNPGKSAFFAAKIEQLKTN